MMTVTTICNGDLKLDTENEQPVLNRIKLEARKIVAKVKKFFTEIDLSVTPGDRNHYLPESFFRATTYGRLHI